MNEIIIGLVTGVGAVALLMTMLYATSFVTFWTLVFIGRICALVDNAIHVLRWRKCIPAHEWKRIREIALPYIDK